MIFSLLHTYTCIFSCIQRTYTYTLLFNLFYSLLFFSIILYLCLYKMNKEKEKLTRKGLSLEQKYFIIKDYESIEHTGRGAKKKIVDKFDLKRITTLNTILSQSDQIIAKYESNEANSNRKRLTKSRNEEIDNELFNTFKLVRQQKGEHVLSLYLYNVISI